MVRREELGVEVLTSQGWYRGYITLPMDAQLIDFLNAKPVMIALTHAACSELAPHGVMVHAVGRGIRQFHDADPGIPSDLGGAVLALCVASRNGQIVNLEDS